MSRQINLLIVCDNSIMYKNRVRRKYLFQIHFQKFQVSEMFRERIGFFEIIRISEKIEILKNFKTENYGIILVLIDIESFSTFSRFEPIIVFSKFSGSYTSLLLVFRTKIWNTYTLLYIFHYRSEYISLKYTSKHNIL